MKRQGTSMCGPLTLGPPWLVFSAGTILPRRFDFRSPRWNNGAQACVARWHLACCGKCSLLPPQLWPMEHRVKSNEFIKNSDLPYCKMKFQGRLLWRSHSSWSLLNGKSTYLGYQNQHSTIRSSLLKSVIRGGPGHWQDRNEKIKAHFTDKSKIRERWQVCRCEEYKRVLVYQ